MQVTRAFSYLIALRSFRTWAVLIAILVMWSSMPVLTAAGAKKVVRPNVHQLRARHLKPPNSFPRYSSEREVLQRRLEAADLLSLAGAGAVQTLVDLEAEYQDRLDSLQGSAVAEKKDGLEQKPYELLPDLFRQARQYYQEGDSENFERILQAVYDLVKRNNPPEVANSVTAEFWLEVKKGGEGIEKAPWSWLNSKIADVNRNRKRYRIPQEVAWLHKFVASVSVCYPIETKWGLPEIEEFEKNTATPWNQLKDVLKREVSYRLQDARKYRSEEDGISRLDKAETEEAQLPWKVFKAFFLNPEPLSISGVAESFNLDPSEVQDYLNQTAQKLEDIEPRSPDEPIDGSINENNIVKAALGDTGNLGYSISHLTVELYKDALTILSKDLHWALDLWLMGYSIRDAAEEQGITKFKSERQRAQINDAIRQLDGQ